MILSTGIVLSRLLLSVNAEKSNKTFAKVPGGTIESPNFGFDFKVDLPSETGQS